MSKFHFAFTGYLNYFAVFGGILMKLHVYSFFQFNGDRVHIDLPHLPHNEKTSGSYVESWLYFYLVGIFLAARFKF